MTYRPIGDYGIIGDMHTAALVGLNGSIDWLCLPDFDSPGIFASILDDDKGGFFSITTTSPESNTRQFYFPETNVLITRFTDEACVTQIADFMLVHESVSPDDHERHGQHAVDLLSWREYRPGLCAPSVEQRDVQQRRLVVI